MASHLSWFVNSLFLLLILVQAPSIYTKPPRAVPTADVIAGNEFLKLFLHLDELQREFHSAEYSASQYVPEQIDSSSTSRSSTRARSRVTRANQDESPGETNTPSSKQMRDRGPTARRHYYKNHKIQTPTTTATTAKVIEKETKQLVTKGSTIAFLDDYDDSDAFADAVEHEIDLKKEFSNTNAKQIVKQKYLAHVQQKSETSDEVKVVAGSVSSSNKQGSESIQNQSNRTSDAMSKNDTKYMAAHTSTVHITDIIRQQHKPLFHTNVESFDESAIDILTMKQTLTTTPQTGPMTITSDTATLDDFVSRSHKSELTIDEVEPLTMSPHKQRVFKPKIIRANSSRSMRTSQTVNGGAMKKMTVTNYADDEDSDSANSASTNIHKVLAVPLLQSASKRTTTIKVPAEYHSVDHSGRNVTSLHTNHNNALATAQQHDTEQANSNDDAIMLETSAMEAVASATDVEEKLLPFQTVIYHNTKEGHGPQSRSISYSSLSQNVEDLQKWRHIGILAEAQRNVSESLKPQPRPQMAHTSEPAKFYSMPSKMYSEPSKFYSEPAKVYSEPAKVYGKPEKFYSEPAKLYGQPSKFYSEPSKVYSQPAKVYGEQSKTYWSPSANTPIATTSTTTTTTSTTVRPTTTTTTTTTTTVRPVGSMPSRKPAIVSRIAFGEAQTSTIAPRVANDPNTPATMPVVVTNQQQQQQSHQQQQQHYTKYQHNTRFQPHIHSHSQSVENSHKLSINPPHSQTSHSPSQSQPIQSQSHSPQSQPRRVLFNLDKLPYDLLNAPVQSSQHLLDPDFSHNPPAAVTYSSPRQRQCLESAFSVSLFQSNIQQKQQQQQNQQQQRHHSSLSGQHSNQNAKGLPNRDLVKCVSIYNQPTVTSTTTTETGHNGDEEDDKADDDLYTPTPEQNYEIEESVSVMTNGQAHGVQGNVAATTTAKPYAMHNKNFPNRGGIQHQQQQQQLYHSNTNTNADNNYDDDGPYIGDGSGLDFDSGGGGSSDGGSGGNEDEGIGADGNNTENDDDEDAKVAYVVEGRNYRKYRVEEKTDDGFIVGVYGVVDHNDGNLRGVRYTADSTINRSLIQKALLTFLKLK